LYNESNTGDRAQNPSIVYAVTHVTTGAIFIFFVFEKNTSVTEQEEEGIGVTSDVVKVKGEDPDTPGYLRGDR